MPAASKFEVCRHAQQKRNVFTLLERGRQEDGRLLRESRVLLANCKTPALGMTASKRLSRTGVGQEEGAQTARRQAPRDVGLLARQPDSPQLCPQPLCLPFCTVRGGALPPHPSLLPLLKGLLLHPLLLHMTHLSGALVSCLQACLCLPSLQFGYLPHYKSHSIREKARKFASLDSCALTCT